MFPKTKKKTAASRGHEFELCWAFVTSCTPSSASVVHLFPRARGRPAVVKSRPAAETVREILLSVRTRVLRLVIPFERRRSFSVRLRTKRTRPPARVQITRPRDVNPVRRYCTRVLGGASDSASEPAARVGARQGGKCAPLATKKNVNVKKQQTERRNYKRVRPDTETPEIATTGAARFPSAVQNGPVRRRGHRLRARGKNIKKIVRAPSR